MDTLDLARWQFAITTVYHFFFVPVTLSLVAVTAGLQTAWYRTGKDKYLRLTKFYGKLFLINIAMGVVTGLVQEFQFGMNWSDYSRFVGDVFGAPLALEGLLAFFLESTFIGLWIFGWDRLPKKVHLACIWMVVLGTQLSAYFILAANSWMQNPVGFRYNAERGRAELTDIGAVLTNKVVLVTYPHTIFAAFMVGGAFVAAVAIWHLVRRPDVDTGAFRTALRLGAIMVIVAGAGVALSGDQQGKVMTQVQPMKMAAAEALWDGEAPAPFSIFAYGDVEAGHNTVAIQIPGILSFLAHDDFSSYVPGINDVNKSEQEKFGPGDYRPNIPVAYWGFRWMIGFGMASFGLGLLGLWLTRKKFLLPPAMRTGEDEAPNLVLFRNKPLGARFTKWYWLLALWTMGFPLIASSWGWIFTETGRQPWVVYGVLHTRDAVSPGVSQGEVLTSMIVFTSLYAVLAVIEVRLLLKYVKAGPPELTEDDLNPPTKIGGDDHNADRPMAFSY